MIHRGISVASIVAAGAIVAGALFWALLSTPDSNPLMLASSALLVLLIVAASALATNAATLVARGESIRDASTAAARGVGSFLIAFSPLLLAWLAIGRVDRWIVEHQGEINAWFIARFGWADMTWLIRAETWMSRWLRWAMVPAICLSLLAALLTSEHRMTWLRRAFHWRTLLVVTVSFAVLMALPWQLTVWRPALPPTWVQPLTAALRLAATFVLGVTGAAIVVLTATRKGERL